MSTLQQRISAFARLGIVMAEAASGSPSSPDAVSLRQLMAKQEQQNKWFTPDNVLLSVRAIAYMLEKKKLEKWLEKYNIPDKPAVTKTVAVIMAGNIPLVGFHDLLCVLISGNRIIARTSSKDSQLIRELSAIIKKINGELGNNIIFTDRISSGYDAVIATGSDNTSRYFEYYFGKKPHIFRKNRNSVAVIRAKTSEKDIQSLSGDIFSYFGLGCRNVSKIYIEKGVNISGITAQWQKWSEIINHKPYANNYLYNKSLLSINRTTCHDNGFSLLVNNTGLSSPVSVIYYDFFDNEESLMNELRIRSDRIQCIVSDNSVRFGETQFPEPADYADNIDTIEFLNSL